MLSNPGTLNGFSALGPYGVEFSPNNDYLYVTDNSTTTSNVYQYNITLPSAAAISGSRLRAQLRNSTPFMRGSSTPCMLLSTSTLNV